MAHYHFERSCGGGSGPTPQFDIGNDYGGDEYSTHGDDDYLLSSQGGYSHITTTGELRTPAGSGAGDSLESA